ncbi:glycoside hydrolase [Acephala macrosclerotiorum]|nr:glycoside hydrolase [Acephala macrosclerotiorum]
MQINSAFIFSFLLPAAYAQLHGAAKTAVCPSLLGHGDRERALRRCCLQAALQGNNDFGQVIPGNSMKWDSIQPAPNTFSFTAGDAIADLAAANKQLLRCHNLDWHQQLPAWVTWDVVNEALYDNGTFRNDVFFNTLGMDYINILSSRGCGPSCEALLQRLREGIPRCEEHSSPGYREMFKAANIKIDGIGFQTHFTVGGTLSAATQVTNMQAFTGLGVEVAITELDIRMTLPQTDALLAQQKTDYQTTAAACLVTKNCVGVTVWDFDDKCSWIGSTFPGTDSGDLMDAIVTKKPAYFGVLRAFTGKVSDSTNSTGTTGISSSTTSTKANMTVSVAPLKLRSEANCKSGACKVLK